MEKHIVGWKDGQKRKWTDRDKLSVLKADRQTDEQAGRWTCRTFRQIDGQTDTLTVYYIDIQSDG
jgi:hypothetical protein